MLSKAVCRFSSPNTFKNKKIKLRMTYPCCQDYNVLSILKLLAVLSCPSRLKIQCLNRNTSNTQK